MRLRTHGIKVAEKQKNQIKKLGINSSFDEFITSHKIISLFFIMLHVCVSARTHAHALNIYELVCVCAFANVCVYRYVPAHISLVYYC